MATLLEELANRKDIELHVATVTTEFATQNLNVGNVTYHLLGSKRRLFTWSDDLKYLPKCADIVRAVGCDLVHVHGTELAYGLLAARKLIDVPVIVSLQGLLGPCVGRVYGSLKGMDCLRAQTLPELVSGRGLWHTRRDYERRAVREREMLSAARWVAGRTAWDRAYLSSISPSARYFHVGEILRPEFRGPAWHLQSCDKFRIIFTNASTAMKDVETLLRGAVILRREFPELRIALAGNCSARNGYFRHWMRQVRRLGLAGAVEFLGFLDAEKMAQELRRSHVFVTTSHLDNSPNALAEAMSLGMPCVATYPGGIPSIVANGETGLLIPVSDEYWLSSTVRRIFTNDELATGLGRNAREVARERHDPSSIVSALLESYREIWSSAYLRQKTA
jgi:glycosyltransferase involved in cell wall biosynthesis